jgi:hypothetical protein
MQELNLINGLLIYLVGLAIGLGLLYKILIYHANTGEYDGVTKKISPIAVFTPFIVAGAIILVLMCYDANRSTEIYNYCTSVYDEYNTIGSEISRCTPIERYEFNEKIRQANYYMAQTKKFIGKTMCGMMIKSDLYNLAESWEDIPEVDVTSSTYMEKLDSAVETAINTVTDTLGNKLN